MYHREFNWYVKHSNLSPPLVQCLIMYVQIFSWFTPWDKHGSALIPEWISNHISCKVWDEITYPFLNLNGGNIYAMYMHM